MAVELAAFEPERTRTGDRTAAPLPGARRRAHGARNRAHEHGDVRTGTETDEGRAVSSGRRVVLLSTGLAIAVLAGVLSFLSWDRANQVAGVVSALVGVAALGTSVYAVLAPSRGASVQVSRTGKAVATGGGDANTGLVLPSSGGTPASASISDTGDARADGGRANTGFRQG